MNGSNAAKATEKKDDPGMIVKNQCTVILHVVLFILLTIAFAGQASADNRTQAKRIFDRLAGTVPSATVLDTMEALIATSNHDDAVSAAYIAMNNKNFYNTTLVNWITPWTNEARAIFPEDMETEGTLNDFTATVIGAIRDDIDFRRILYDNIMYKGKDSLGLPAYSNSDNAHYKALEERSGLDLSQDLVPENEAIQSLINTALPSSAISGVLTSRAAAKAFFVAGTNRAMTRFTLLNFLCKDMNEINDVTLPADRIRQDVSRSPGGDSRIYMNSCIGCHSGMDPMTQAFAYYDYSETDNKLVFTGGVVQPKNLINSDNFKPGYIVPDDHWVNYWRKGKNSLFNWDVGLPASGQGASSMAKELSHSEQFARCQVEKVFKAVCLHPPLNSADRTAVNDILAKFKLPFKKPSGTGYELKRVFAETAVYCKGQ